MPPPIATQSGSRAALVTWTVVASILFVVMTVLAIFATVNSNKAQADLALLQSKYESVVAPGDLTGETVTNLQAVRQADPTLGSNLLAVAVAQRNNLARTVSGTDAPADATAAAANALKAVKAAGVKTGGDSLVGAVNGLVGEVKSRDGQIKDLTEARDSLSKQLAAVNADAKAQLEAAKADVAKQTTTAGEASTGAETYRKSKDETVAEVQKNADTAAAAAQEAINALTAQNAEAAAKTKKTEDQVKALQNKLRDVRLPVDQIVRQADAHVMRVAGDNILYVDLGTGDGVTPGMSFEIYDRVRGVPKSGDPTTEVDLPKGKASIEIIKVSPGSSECRVVRQTPGEPVVEGDTVVNLIFDKNVKYNVMVYGNFDLDRNGQATPSDAEVIKRLVTRWGGKVTSSLNANTDFLVIGKMPEMPTFTQEELDRPEIQFRVEQIKKEITSYDDVLAQAIQYNIPVLNQNRFLYFTGYYEQATR